MNTVTVPTVVIPVISDREPMLDCTGSYLSRWSLLTQPRATLAQSRLLAYETGPQGNGEALQSHRRVGSTDPDPDGKGASRSRRVRARASVLVLPYQHPDRGATPRTWLQSEKLSPALRGGFCLEALTKAKGEEHAGL